MGERPGIAVSRGVGHRCGSDPAWLWLWGRPAAVVLIRPLAWELPYAMAAALKRPKKKKKKKKKDIKASSQIKVSTAEGHRI